MLILNIIAIILIVIAVYAGDLRYNPVKAKPIYWVLIAAALILIAVSGAISGTTV